MRIVHWAMALALGGSLSSAAFGADIMRQLTTEFDPVAPASAAYQHEDHGIAASMWGLSADFNVGGFMSTGPELWMGNFTVRGPTDPTQTYRREDFWPGEQQKIDAMRLRWNFTWWEQPASMRGWYVKGGYSYTRINSRANRYQESGGQGDAVPAGILPDSNIETNFVTDIRHGAMLGFGNRWMFASQKLTVTLGASITGNFKRTVSVDGKDPNARADYESLIEDLPDTRMSTQPLPEANLGLGYAW